MLTLMIQLILLINAQTQHGCQDDTSFTVTVYPDPIAQINQLASVYCAPLQ